MREDEFMYIDEKEIRYGEVFSSLKILEPIEELVEIEVRTYLAKEKESKTLEDTIEELDELRKKFEQVEVFPEDIVLKTIRRINQELNTPRLQITSRGLMKILAYTIKEEFEKQGYRVSTWYTRIDVDITAKKSLEEGIELVIEIDVDIREKD